MISTEPMYPTTGLLMIYWRDVAFVCSGNKKAFEKAFEEADPLIF